MAAANDQQPNVILIMADDLGQEVSKMEVSLTIPHSSANWRKRVCGFPTLTPNRFARLLECRS